MELVEFPAPLGEVPALLFGHPEPITLPKTIDAKNIALRGGISPPWNNKALSAMRSIGLTNSKGKIDFSARNIHRIQRLFSIGGVTNSGLRIDIMGTKDGQERHLVFNMIDRFRPLVSIPCTIGGLMLLEGKITKRGVMAPEMCIEPVEFFDRLSDKGVKIMREGRL
jgi:saccharopine dehydrogenase-like NADP-dependent oxidoreductase